LRGDGSSKNPGDDGRQQASRTETPHTVIDAWRSSNPGPLLPPLASELETTELSRWTVSSSRLAGRALPETLVRRFAEDVSAPVTLLSLGPAHTSGRTPPAGCPGINGTLCANSCGTDTISNDSRSPVNVLALNTAGSSPVHVLPSSRSSRAETTPSVTLSHVFISFSPLTQLSLY
jgi:hypothetical protein